MKMRFALLALSGLLAACGPAATTGGGPVSHNRDIVTRDELLATRATNLYDALHQVRPEFFTARGVSSIRLSTPDLPMVYLDRNRLGSLNDSDGQDGLRGIDINIVREVRHLTPRESAIILGTDSPGGALLVTTIKKP